jgi:hypothetical protein
MPMMSGGCEFLLHFELSLFHMGGILLIPKQEKDSAKKKGSRHFRFISK